MIPIPLDENTINGLCGRIVCVVTKDGQRHIGRLSSCNDGRLILNDDPNYAESHTKHVAAENSKGKKNKKKPNSKAKSKTSKATKSSYPEDDSYSEGYAGPNGGPEYSGYGHPPYGGSRSYPYPYPPVPFGPRLGFDLAAIAFLFLLFV